MAIQYACRNQQRKLAVLAHGGFNGIDFLEVRNLDSPPGAEPDPRLAQRRLVVRFLKEDDLDDLRPANIRIDGGQRVRDFQVTRVYRDGVADGETLDSRDLVIELDRAGDFSAYTLHIVRGPGNPEPPAWLDPVLAYVPFSFKVACPSDFDCRVDTECLPERLPEPEIDYLAKDYNSFRQLMLNRLSTVMPAWQERNPSDIGVAVVEVLAYAADHLSYYQDAVATEAYLGTARRRVSVRRHARMLDYFMHDGCNARAWIALEIGDGADNYLMGAHTPFFAGHLERVEIAPRLSPVPVPTPTPAPAPPTLRQFALLAVATVRLQDDTEVHDGHVGANNLAAAAWSVDIETKVHVQHKMAAVYADRLRIAAGAKLGDIHYNQLSNAGDIKGQSYTPLALPLFSSLPAVPAFSPGSVNFTVAKNSKRTLAAGDYNNLKVNESGTLYLSGGTYNLASWTLADHARVYAEAECEVRVAGRLIIGGNAKIRRHEADEDADKDSEDFLIYVTGVNGNDGEVDDDDEDQDNKNNKNHHDDDGQTGSGPAVLLGDHADVVAVIYAPLGTVQALEYLHLKGRIFARDIDIGEHGQIHGAIDIVEPEPEPEPEPNPVPERNFITVLEGDVQVFESMHELRLRGAYNRIEFYTWGDEECCLPTGATRASLVNPDDPGDPSGVAGLLDALKVGDLLLFEEIADANGITENADMLHRQVVRLTGAEFVTDPVENNRKVVNITWSDDDALSFPLCLVRAVLQQAGVVVSPVPQSVSVARGNVVLVDHGRSLLDEPLVPDVVPQTGRYRPRLARTPVTFHVPATPEQLRSLPASQLLIQDPRRALPDAELEAGFQTWVPRRDLLNSDRFAPEFVAETEEDGRSYLRFGDGVLGRKPTPGSRFTATYRIGNGSAGNIGADTITRLKLPAGDSSVEADILRVWNPLAAAGGSDPEPIEDVRTYAPQAFRTQRRAVTVQDYAVMAETHPEVQKAVATSRWTGSWHTVFLAIDRRGGRPVDAEFELGLRAYLEPLRVMGHDLEVEAPRLAPLDIALTVCVDPGYLRSEVKAALLEALSSAELADGRLGFFHPDNWTFGQAVYRSKLMAAAMAVAGVVWVDPVRFQRWGQEAGISGGEPAIPALLAMGRLEIARLDNDPSAPENGRLEFIMMGGL